MPLLKIKVKFDIGDFVYILSDSSQRKCQVVSITLYPKYQDPKEDEVDAINPKKISNYLVIYAVSVDGEQIDCWELELSSDKNVIG